MMRFFLLQTCATFASINYLDDESCRVANLSGRQTHQSPPKRPAPPLIRRYFGTPPFPLCHDLAGPAGHSNPGFT